MRSKCGCSWCAIGFYEHGKAKPGNSIMDLKTLLLREMTNVCYYAARFFNSYMLKVKKKYNQLVLYVSDHMFKYRIYLDLNKGSINPGKGYGTSHKIKRENTVK